MHDSEAPISIGPKYQRRGARYEGSVIRAYVLNYTYGPSDLAAQGLTALKQANVN